MSAAAKLAANSRPAWQRFGLAILAIAAVTLAATPLLGHLDLANIVMLFLPGGPGRGGSPGRGPALLAAFLAVGPSISSCCRRFSMTVNDGQYLITFAVMLAAALDCGNWLPASSRQAEEAVRREAVAQALYEMARDLAGAPTLDK